MLTTDSILKELSVMSEMSTDIVDFLEDANSFLNSLSLNEAEYDKVTAKLRLEILDVDRSIKVNECKVVTNPRAFIRDGIPSDDGLLSITIFGNTMEEKMGKFGYIDLHGNFMNPSLYKAWTRLDKRIRNIVHGIGFYRIDDRGQIVEDEKGKTGIDFLYKNIKKIKFKTSSSSIQDIRYKYLEQNRDNIFMTKMIVIPVFYRDKNTASDRSVGLGGVNKLYNNLIIATNALEETQDYMFDPSDAMNGRVQEYILAIYDYLCGNSNATLNNIDGGLGLGGKLGIIRMTNMSKTANFTSRMVLSAPELKVERPEDMMSTIEKSAIPLAAIMAEFRDFIIFHTKSFFENEFNGIESYPVIDEKGNLKYIIPEDPEIAFSTEVIKREMERYLHGYVNRFVPIEVPQSESKTKYYMQFKGRNNPSIDNDSIYNRPLTWCDVFFIAATEATTNKKVLITRFPVDSYTNQIVTGIEISSTKETEPMYFNDKYYKYYPKIRLEDLGTDTSNKFVDTMKLSNLYLKGMGGDKHNVA